MMTERDTTQECHSFVGDDGWFYFSRQMREPAIIAPRYPLVGLEPMMGLGKAEKSAAENRALAAWRAFINALPDAAKADLAKRILGRRYEP